MNHEKMRRDLQNRLNEQITDWTQDFRQQGETEMAINRQLEIVLTLLTNKIRTTNQN